MYETLCLLLPQTALVIAACGFILGGSFPVSPRHWGPAALGALLIAAGCLVFSSDPSRLSGSGAMSVITQDPLAVGFQWCCLVAGAIFVLMSLAGSSRSEHAAEFYALLLIMIAGLMLVSAASELILLFLGLELISIPTYVLLYLGRRDPASQEAAPKYFLLSILSAAILLYGFSFLYGLTGSTHLEQIRAVLAGSYAPSTPGLPPGGGSLLGVVALVLIFAGLGFKITAVPFHFYAPDVYQGTSAFNAGLLAVVPKAAGIVALVRVASDTMSGFEETGAHIALILAVITMTIGNCLALLQTNIRRVLAYSGIAHAGYMLIGIAVGFWDVWNPQNSLDAGTGLPGGVRACLLYLVGYSVATGGLFAVLVYLARPGRQVDHIEELTGLVRTHPATAIAAALFLFSLAGIPPLPGFWGKLAVFSSALSVRAVSADSALIPVAHQGFIVLAVIGAVNAAIGAVYYLRIIAIMFLNEPLSTPQPSGGRGAATAVLCSAVLVAALGLQPKPLFDYLENVDLRAGTSISDKPASGRGGNNFASGPVRAR